MGALLEKINDEYAISFCVTQLCLMLALVLIVAHWMACMWHGCVFIADQEVNWVITYFGTDEGLTIWDRYLASLYWAVMTMTTIG